MGDAGRRGAEPDPRPVEDQAEFRRLLRELMRWAGYSSLQQLETAARRQGLNMPVSTADRALSTDRLPTADFVRRFVAACDGDVPRWSATRETLADLKFARNQEPAAGPPLPSPLRADRDDGAAEVCPYPGLAAFAPEQARWFFGRERAIAEVVDHLTRRLEGTGPLVVVAPSGAGKSSLLRAGLLPAVGRGTLPGSRRWPQLLLTPTTHPINALAIDVAALTGTEPQAIFDELVADPGRLADLLRPVLAAGIESSPADAARVVLVVDQFEETFTLCPDERQRSAFIRALCSAATGVDGAAPVALVVLGLRADLYGRCAAYPELVEALRRGQVLLGAMSTAELRDAIEKPAHAVGLDIPPELVEVMLADLGADENPPGIGAVGPEPGALPLLAHALFATWQHRDGRILTLDGYRLTGGIRGAIATTAEHAYRQLDPAGQRIARQLLLRLVHLADGTEDTRRRLDRAGLVTESTDPSLAEEILETLARTRLVTLDEGAVEITHEALLRAWPRLRDWIEADRAGLVVRQRLTEAAEAWDREGRHPSALYQGPRLATTREWVDTGDPDLTPLTRDFLQFSIQRELEEQRAVRRRTRRLRRLVAVLGILVLVASTATVLAVQARDTATRQRNDALSRKVANEAVALRATNPALAAQLSVAAFRLAPTAEARGSLLSTLSSPYATRLTGFVSGTRGVSAARFSPDGHTLATASDDHTMRLWDVTDRHHPGELATLAGHADRVTSIAFASGTVVITASADRTARLWDISDRRHPRELATLAGHTDVVRAVAFDPDRNLVATASDDKTVRLWDITDPHRPSELALLTGHTDGVAAVAFGLTGRVLATGSSDKTVRLWDITDSRHPAPLATLTDHTDRVLSVAFSPDGRTMATGSFDNTVRLWDVTDPHRPTPLTTLARHSNGVVAIAFSPDGRTMATGSYDNTVRLWDVTNPRHPSEPLVLTGHSDAVYSTAFSPDGRTLATASRDNTARLWDIDGPVLAGQTGPAMSVRFSPDGRTLADGSFLTARLWNVADPHHPTALATLTGHTDGVYATEFSPDGRTLATASLDRTVRLWDVTDPQHPLALATLSGHTDNVMAAVFSPDGHTLASVSIDHTVRLWDVTDPRRPGEPAVLNAHTAGVTSVAFTPDGRIMATGGDDRTARLWDVSDPRHPAELATLTGHTEGIRSVALSSDGHTLATASYDRTARLWDITDPHRPSELATLTGHTDRVVAVAFSPDGQTLATAGFDNTAGLWNVADLHHPYLLARLTGHTDRVLAVAFSPDGQTLATASDDRTARLWDLDPERVARQICAITQPTITSAEWNQYFPDVDFTPPCA